ncbi:MAG: phosphoribosyltransferase-like protein [Cognatishimia sp.]
MSKLTRIPQSWDYPAEGSQLPNESVSMIEFLSKKVFNDYEPSQFHPFRLRLIDWLNNVDTEEEQQHLLALLLKVFFVGRREFEALYRTVFHGNLFRWMLEVEDIDVFSDDLETQIVERINKAWICPISDSLRINSFLKVNGLKSLDKRPDWRSLKQFGQIEKIQEYVTAKGIRDLVLLEDFVGSGTQAKGAVKFAAEALPDTRILLCPLIVCPNGDEVLSDVVKTLDNVTYDPALLLPPSAFHSFDNAISDDADATEKFLCDLKPKLGTKSDKYMFGFKQTGAKVVMHSNCPNNSLPIFHHESPSWVPLFPRVNRQ